MTRRGILQFVVVMGLALVVVCVIEIVNIMPRLATALHPAAPIKNMPTGPLADKVDKSLLTHVPCAPPCWYGIVPGKSSVADTQRILGGLQFVRSFTDYSGHFIDWRSSLTD